MKPGRSDMIYQFFKTQIEFGYFQKGDCLPSIASLCSTYHAALQTVRSAYLQLQEEGYIQINWGKNTVAAYDASAEVCYQTLQDYYLARENAIRNLDQNIGTFFLPLLIEGAHRLQAKEMRHIKEIAEQMSWDSLYIGFYSCRQMLFMLKNPLILDLFYEIVLFFQFPHTLAKRIPLPDAEQQYRTLTQQLATACEQEDRDEFIRVYIQISVLLNDLMFLFMEKAGRERIKPEPVGFQWKVYHEHAQICYSAAAHLIGRIFIQGAYVPGDFLPSYGTMAKTGGVSFSTIRRMIELLSFLGVVSSSQGLGAWVTEPSMDTIRLEKKRVQKILSMFLQVIQIISLSLDNIVNQFFPGPRWRIEECLERLRVQSGFRILLTGVGILLYGNDDRTMTEIWAKFHEILLLGLPLLEGYASSHPEIAAQLETFPEDMIHSLEEEDPEVFSDSLRGIMALSISTAELISKNKSSTLGRTVGGNGQSESD